jgi:hypothetical protein
VCYENHWIHENSYGVMKNKRKIREKVLKAAINKLYCVLVQWVSITLIGYKNDGAYRGSWPLSIADAWVAKDARCGIGDRLAMQRHERDFVS